MLAWYLSIHVLLLLFLVLVFFPFAFCFLSRPFLFCLLLRSYKQFVPVFLLSFFFIDIFLSSFRLGLPPTKNLYIRWQLINSCARETRYFDLFQVFVQIDSSRKFEEKTKKKTCFPRACATCPELPYNISWYILSSNTIHKKKLFEHTVYIP